MAVAWWLLWVLVVAAWVGFVCWIKAAATGTDLGVGGNIGLKNCILCLIIISSMAGQKTVSGAEFRRKYKGNKVGRSRGTGRESELQQGCVKWFRLAYPEFRNLLISIPNSSASTLGEGSRFKREGLMPGASDLFLFVARDGWHGLGIEMKTDVGRLSEQQLDWGVGVLESGYLYVVCRSFDGFRSLVNEYLGNG